ncbi:plantaricin C family lantibiotic [Salipaludibacillus daqingensis]|uniref:plantaricin C family lantibiotic n=1 Tax=Salipaludibacillus daqingensis TaxID=3041001 RepID=UPI0024736187|nr:plantaricin C family lantibiotic [Salipaludibacillus daqingensis]
MEVIKYWKNPENRAVENVQVANPAGDVMDELSDQESDMVVGGCRWYNISCRLGNDGRFCTLTVECQRNCN